MAAQVRENRMTDHLHSRPVGWPRATGEKSKVLERLNTDRVKLQSMEGGDIF